MRVVRDADQRPTVLPHTRALTISLTFGLMCSASIGASPPPHPVLNATACVSAMLAKFLLLVIL